MSLSLHEAVVPGFLQTLGVVSGLLDKAEAHVRDSGIAETELLGDRLAPDMHDLAYQVKSVAVHSWGAIEGVRRGVFNPDAGEPGDLAALRGRLAAARAGLEEVTADEIAAIEGRLVEFVAGSFRRPFTATTFLLSFSQPNCHFHASMAYALLRRRGVAIGKRDYLGAMRVGGPA